MSKYAENLWYSMLYHIGTEFAIIINIKIKEVIDNVKNIRNQMAWPWRPGR